MWGVFIQEVHQDICSTLIEPDGKYISLVEIVLQYNRALDLFYVE